MSTQNVVDPKEAYLLVVEDNTQNMLLLSRLLDHMGVKGYQWRASGWDLLTVVGQMPRVDLILLDIHLPHEDGFELLQTMRSDARLADTRIVAVTADVTPQTVEKARRAGFDGFLGKPISPRDFPQQITDILQGKPVWEPAQK